MQKDTDTAVLDRDKLEQWGAIPATEESSGRPAATPNHEVSEQDARRDSRQRTDDASTRGALTGDAGQDQDDGKDDDDKKDGPLGLSFAQVAGSALAAATAGAIGSQLGTAGTVLGYALFSLIAAVAGAAYTGGLKKSATVVRKGRDVVGPATRRLRGTAGDADEQATGSSSISIRPPRRRLVLQVLGSFAMIAVLAGGAITAYESLTGHALSGGTGTTVSQVATGQTDAPRSTQDRTGTRDDQPASGSQQDDRTDGTTETRPTNRPTTGAAPDNGSTSGNNDSTGNSGTTDRGTDSTGSGSGSTGSGSTGSGSTGSGSTGSSGSESRSNAGTGSGSGSSGSSGSGSSGGSAASGSSGSGQ